MPLFLDLGVDNGGNSGMFTSVLIERAGEFGLNWFVADFELPKHSKAFSAASSSGVNSIRVTGSGFLDAAGRFFESGHRKNRFALFGDSAFPI